MKSNHITIIIIMLVSAISNTTIGQSKISTLSKEQKFGHIVFEAFQKRNDSLWVSLFPTNAEYRELTKLMFDAKIIQLPQQEVNAMLARHDKEATAAYRDEFHVFLKQADSLAINWHATVFEKFDFDTIYPEKFSWKYLNGDLWFACKKSHFVIEGIEAVETPSGYKLQSIRGLRQVDDGE